MDIVLDASIGVKWFNDKMKTMLKRLLPYRIKKYQGR